MRLSIVKKNNDTFYYILDSYREGDRVVTKTYAAIGKRSDLLRVCDDPDEYARRKVEEANEERRSNKLTVSKKIDFSEKVAGEGQASARTSLNVGWLYLRGICRELRLDEFLPTVAGKARYDLASVVMYTMGARVVRPGSKLADHAARLGYYGAPDYKVQDAYKAIRAVGAATRELQDHLFKACKDAKELSTDVLYYDCTNFYMETEEEDGDLLDAEGDIVQWGLRRYGVSKEHRPNPIVQMGLFVDANGIPVSYCIAPGNTNEQQTTVPLEQRMVEDYGHSRFIYCADGGLGSAEARFYNTLDQRDYVVAQSLKKMKKEDQDLIFKDLNWRFVDDDSPASLEEFKGLCDRLAEGEALTEAERSRLSRDMIYKRYPVERAFDPSGLAGARIKGKVTFEETVLVTFSAKYYLYQRKVFTRQLLRAEGWVEKGISKRSNPNDVSRLTKTVATTADGEVATRKSVAIDEDAVREERAYHGFYAVATSLQDGIKRVLKINADRWRIEYQFRIMKTEFSDRPAFVWTDEGLRGHFAVCYAAQVVYSVLERRLKKIDPSLTTRAIVTTLRNMEVVDEGSYYKAIYTNSKALAALEKRFGYGLDAAYLRESGLKKLV